MLKAVKTFWNNKNNFCDRKMGRKNIADFGYGFNEEGKLRQLDPETNLPGEKPFDFNVTESQTENQKHYEELGEAVTDYIYEQLEKHKLNKIYVPEAIPKEQATFIFSSQIKLNAPKKLLILIHGSGVVRAGQWARSLVINQSMDHGSMLPYIEEGRKLGYEIIITNGNDNYRRNKPIPGHSSPTAHGTYIWEKYVMACKPEAVAIVAHSYGGVVAMDLVKTFPEFFQSHVFAIALTDSVHGRLPSNASQYLQKIGRNFVGSTLPLNQHISSNDDIPRFSAGHPKHEWTSYACQSALFEFLENKFEEFSASTQ